MNTRPFVAPLLLALGLSAGAEAQVVVPPGFVAEQLSGRLDNVTPRIEAIRNPAYGTGVVAASVSNQILTVRRLDAGSVSVVATMPMTLAASFVADLRFDGVGVQDNHLFVSIRSGDFQTTQIIRIEPDGATSVVTTLGDAADELGLTFDFTTGLGGYLPGAYMNDVAGPDGTSMWHWSPSNVFSRLAQDSVPAGRSDLDIRGLEFDRTGVFNNRLVLVDNDSNQSGINAVYTLSPSLQWQLLGSQLSTATIYFRDLAISPGGAFGQFIYVLDARADRVARIDGAGVISTFATGFTVASEYDGEADGSASLTVSNSGNTLFVADTNGVYRIREAAAVPGPTIVMREPSLPAGVPFTNPSGIGYQRILWSAPITFSPSDIAIVRQSDGAPVAFSASGSGSAFMILSFAQPLLNDTYVITINDTVVAASGGAAIDGDNNGLAGGDAVLTLVHDTCTPRTCDADWDNNGVVNSTDVSEFINAWFSDIATGCGG